MILEGGFQGRTNKLVDGCYSFWGAGDFPILSAALDRRGLVSDTHLDYLFDRGRGTNRKHMLNHKPWFLTSLHRCPATLYSNLLPR